MKLSLLIITTTIIHSVTAQFDVPKHLDFGAPFRPVSFSCYKSNPDCLVVGIEKSDCIRNGGLLADCRDIYESIDCQSCYVQDVEVHRYIAFAAVNNWCIQHGGLANEFKSSPLCNQHGLII